MRVDGLGFRVQLLGLRLLTPNHKGPKTQITGPYYLGSWTLRASNTGASEGSLVILGVYRIGGLMATLL